MLNTLMKLYLSSYRLGYKAERLTELLKPKNGQKKVAFIANALDAEANYIRVLHSTNRDVTDLQEVGITVERLDLKEYFGKSEKLEKKLQEFSGVYIRGGNVFVLKEAFVLSGLDAIVQNLANANDDFVYAGYGAGVCILSKLLRGLELVYSIEQYPEEYPARKEKDISTEYDGLGLLDFSVAPHFRSDHPESQAINRTIEFFMEEKILFLALRDGEVLIGDTKKPRTYEILKTTGAE